MKTTIEQSEGKVHKYKIVLRSIHILLYLRLIAGNRPYFHILLIRK